jgi:hypothetical protein
MSRRRARRATEDPDGASIAAPVEGVPADPCPPWEQIENGRYMPRRIRGSCRGRELG